MVYRNLFMTSTPFPVAVNALQKTAGPNGVATVNAVYQPSRIKRATAVEYAIGLEDTTVDVTWYPDDNNHFTEMIHPGIGNPGPWGWKWALLAGYFDETPMYIHKAYFTPPTTPNGYPTCSALL